jgi:hypothetical protein
MVLGQLLMNLKLKLHATLMFKWCW